ncbi:hypothetical protein [Acinetobacter sp. neg1]|uniref:hypothetical protein n=1 Tax=Acinetobacter sp. neg1 TaxID=1561068 RepID=UPI000645C4C7|nr:hypothetical protein [Acinetobacter sp. neg1]
MRKYLYSFFSMMIVVGLVACDRKTPFDYNEVAAIEKKNPVGSEMLVHSSLITKGVDIEAKVNQYDLIGNKYYFDLKITNKTNKPIVLKTKKILLVDTDAKTHTAGLVDSDIIKPISPGITIGGVVGFDYKNGKHLPSFIKIEE